MEYIFKIISSNIKRLKPLYLFVSKAILLAIECNMLHEQLLNLLFLYLQSYVPDNHIEMQMPVAEYSESRHCK